MRPEQRQRPVGNGAPLSEAGQATSSTLAQRASAGDQPTPFQPMPPLTVEEYASLRDDVAERGIVVPVVVDQHGRMLDGHHRTQVAAELGIECPTTVHHVIDDAAMDAAVTLNAARRHLSREQRRQLIADEMIRRPDDSDRAVGRRVGCSPSTVGSVRVQVSKLDTPAPPVEPPKQRRRPLPDAYRDASDKALKVAESLSRLHADDRFASNREAVVRRNAATVARAANELLDLLEDLGVERHKYGGGS